MDFLRQLRPNSLGLGNFFNGGFAKPVNGSKFSQQQILSVLADAWAIIEDAFLNTLLQKQLMISIGETMCLISNPL